MTDTATPDTTARERRDAWRRERDPDLTVDDAAVVASINVESIAGLIPGGDFRLGYDRYGRPGMTRYLDAPWLLDEPPVNPRPVPAVPEGRQWTSTPQGEGQQHGIRRRLNRLANESPAGTRPAMSRLDIEGPDTKLLNEPNPERNTP